MTDWNHAVMDDMGEDKLLPLQWHLEVIKAVTVSTVNVEADLRFQNAWCYCASPLNSEYPLYVTEGLVVSV